MRVIEFYGGPSIGKSTCAMATTLGLKLGHEAGRWVDPLCVEYVPEYAAEQVRAARQIGGDPRRALQNQLQLAGMQLHYLERLACDGVELAVCDSPLWLCAVYGAILDRYPDDAWRHVLRAHYLQPISTPSGPSKLEVLPVLLERVPRHHDMRGRVQVLTEAVELDDAIEKVAVTEWGDQLLRLPARAGDVAVAVIEEVAKRGWLPQQGTP